MQGIYLDNHATTQIDPRVLQKMLPYFDKEFGNPASIHLFGEQARSAVETARDQVAALIRAKSDNVFFTNSATEANNIVFRSDFFRIATTNSEHSSIMECCKNLRSPPENRQIKLIKIRKDGTLDLAKIERLLANKEKIYGTPDLLSVIFANNEIGTVHDIYAIGRLCKKYGVLLHTDASQAVGKIDGNIDVDEMNIFALTMSGHKIYGPKGVGALYIRKPKWLKPLLYGGLQNILSSGTQNVPAIVGMGAACELMMNNTEENKRIAELRDYLYQLLSVSIDDMFINGTMENRLPNNLSLTIVGVPGRVLAVGMDDVFISGGSACQSDSPKPSHVIKALHTPHPECAIRIGLGRFTKKYEIEYAAKRIIETVEAIRRA
jgi:cysteine desulfurase